jgi:hypothetical protein
MIALAGSERGHVGGWKSRMKVGRIEGREGETRMIEQEAKNKASTIAVVAVTVFVNPVPTTSQKSSHCHE